MQHDCSHGCKACSRDALLWPSHPTTIFKVFFFLYFYFRSNNRYYYFRTSSLFFSGTILYRVCYFFPVMLIFNEGGMA